MRALAFGVTLAALVVAVPAGAHDAAPPPADRVRATALAVVPGIAVHGTGHWAARRPSAGRRLLIAELIGLGAAGAGGAALYVTGASRRIVAPAAALVVLGGGLFVASWLADLWGAVDPGARDGEGSVLSVGLVRVD